jgi:hypothetical protein
MELWEKSETVDPDVRAYVGSLVTALGGRSTYDDSYGIPCPRNTEQGQWLTEHSNW